MYAPSGTTQNPREHECAQRAQRGAAHAGEGPRAKSGRSRTCLATCQQHIQKATHVTGKTGLGLGTCTLVLGGNPAASAEQEFTVAV